MNFEEQFCIPFDRLADHRYQPKLSLNSSLLTYNQPKLSLNSSLLTYHINYLNGMVREFTGH